MFGDIKDRWQQGKMERNGHIDARKFVFEDWCDLSLIFYELSRTEGEDLLKLSPEDLLFLEFLCLEYLTNNCRGRNHLNQTIIKCYEHSLKFMK
jgi:hypothetical protein